MNLLVFLSGVTLRRSFQITRRSPPMMSKNFLCMISSWMLRRSGSVHTSLKSSKARMRRSVFGGVGSERKVLLAGNGSGVVVVGGDVKLSGYTSGRVMMKLSDGFERDWGLSCSMKFCDGGHGGC